MPILNMPDGTPVSFPDDMPKEQIKSMIVSKFPDAFKEEAPGFTDRVGQAYDKRTGMAQTAVDEYQAGNQTLPEAALQVTGKGVAGFANDVVGEGIKSVSSGVEAMTPQFVQDAVRKFGPDVLNILKHTPQGALATAGIAGQEYAASKYNDFAKDNPRAGRNIDAVADIGSYVAALTPVGGRSAVGTVASPIVKVGSIPAKSVARGSGTVLEGMKARGPEALQDTAKLMRKDAGNIYEKMRQVGAVLNPQKTQELVQNVTDAVSNVKLIPQLNPKTLAVLDDIKGAAQNKSLGFDEIDQYRRLLSGIKDEDAVAAGALRRALDNTVNNLTDSDFITGSRDAVDLLQKGRKEYAKASKFDAVSDILNKADGDPNKIKAGLTRFMNDPDNLKGFAATEKLALKSAARSTTPEKLFKMFGKFGIDLGTSSTPGNTIAPLVGSVVGASSGAIGAAAAPIAGTVSRQLQKYMARGKAEKLLKTIEEGK